MKQGALFHHHELRMNKMAELRHMRIEELFDIANMATGGWLTNPTFSSDRKEVEVGGYDKRRRVQWVDSSDGIEVNYFEISSENSDGWTWHCKVAPEGSVDSISGEPKFIHTVNTIAPHKIVDYLRSHGFNIENKKV